MAFKIAGSMAFKQAYEAADPVLLEPIMEVTTVPTTWSARSTAISTHAGAALQGMEPRGTMTAIRAEVPMAEMLTYAQALTSMTGAGAITTCIFRPLRRGARTTSRRS